VRFSSQMKQRPSPFSRRVAWGSFLWFGILIFRFGSWLTICINRQVYIYVWPKILRVHGQSPSRSSSHGKIREIHAFCMFPQKGSAVMTASPIPIGTMSGAGYMDPTLSLPIFIALETDPLPLYICFLHGIPTKSISWKPSF